MSNLKKQFISIFKKEHLTKSSNSQDFGRERLRRVIFTILSSILSKGLTTLVPLITIPFTYDYLGKEIFGLWMTITSFFTFFAFADFGLGSGLITALSKSYRVDDIHASRRIISSTFFLLIFIALAFLLLFLLSYSFIPWKSLLNITSNELAKLAALVVLFVFIPQIIQMPFSIVQRVQLAVQEGYYTNIWQTAAALINLVSIIIITQLDLGIKVLIFIVSLIPIIMMILNWLSFFTIHHKDLYPRIHDWNSKKSLALLKMGIGFAFLTLLLTLGLWLDNVIVAQTCSLSDVATYSVVSRMSSVIYVVLGMICMPFWSANAEAFARGDNEWVRKMIKRVVIIAFSFILFLEIFIVWLGPQIFHLWIGETFEVSRFLLIGFALRELIFAIASPYFMVLNSIGKVGIQIRMFLIFSVISILLKYIVPYWFGMTGIIYVTPICYSIIILPCLFIVVKNILSAKSQQCFNVRCA
ncbi:MAG: lipopolysaccharide biosynthesis protein [Planctomycetaceae bacterium]|jgi:O-antigen/teichoic acid export membrane protein|nr:lipopolysaccharide biosynthesis protein [Planctomycetaceae bacterium]